MLKQKIIIVIAVAVLAIIFILGYSAFIKKETKPEGPIPAEKGKPVIIYQVTGGLIAQKEEMKIFEERIDHSLSIINNIYFRTADISKEELDNLIELFSENNFTSFDSSHESKVPVSDAQKTIIKFQDKEIIIQETAEIPKELEEIRRELAKKAEWFKSQLPKLEFLKGKGDCSLAAGGGEADIKLEDKDIIFQGRINTGNPCYNLSADLETKEDIFSPETGILTVFIDSSPSDKICIQCAGSVEFSGKITNLSGMTKYKVLIKTGDTIIAEKEIDMPIKVFRR